MNSFKTSSSEGFLPDSLPPDGLLPDSSCSDDELSLSWERKEEPLLLRCSDERRDYYRLSYSRETDGLDIYNLNISSLVTSERSSDN